MIFRAEEKKVDLKENLRGGSGTIQLAGWMEAGQFPAHYRMFSVITLEPGCSIGSHSHEGESEIFYILSGEGTLNDNGKERKVCPGDVCVCYDGETHGIANFGTERFEMLAAIVTNA